MDSIIPLRGDPHNAIVVLLPWYATGQLDPDERDRVEAHLDQCAACRAEAAREQVLRAEVAALPIGAEVGWAKFSDRLVRGREEHQGREIVARLRRSLGEFSRFGWFLSAQAAMIALAVVAIPARMPDATYHALGALPTVAPGNMIVIFKPDARSGDLRQALATAHARVTDGPTTAGAWVLHVEPGARATALASLRARPDVVLAEPIDAGPTP